MRIIDSKIFFTWDDLTKHGFSESFLWKVTSEFRSGNRPSYHNIPDPSDNRFCLISYDGIPEKTRLEKGVPTKTELVKQGLIKGQLQTDTKALAFFLDNPHTYQWAKDYQIIAAYLMYAAPATVTFARELGFSGVDGFYQTIIDLMQAEKFEAWNISNLDRFKRKISPFKKAFKSRLEPDFKAALSNLVSKKFGLKNAAKVVSKGRQSEEIKGVLIKIYADTKKYSIEDTHLTYMHIAKRKFEEYTTSNGLLGWNDKCFITGQTIANFLYDPSIQQVWYGIRHGNGEYKDKFERVTKRIPATYGNAKWVIDGTPLHRYFQDGDSAFNRVHVFFVMDENTWCILGVGISLIGESSGQILQALRAASHNAGIIAGDEKLYSPYEIQSDNSSANHYEAIKKAYDVIGSVHRPSRVGNSKAKVAEPLNKHFFARWMKFRTGFTGSMGMSTDINNKVNQDRLTEIVRKKQLPDLKKTLSQLQEDVNNWNNDKSWKNKDVAEAERLSPLEKFRESLLATQDKQKTITEGQSIEAFYWMPTNAKQIKDTTKKSRQSQTIHIPQEYTFTNKGFKITRKSPLDGKDIKMDFDVIDPSFNEKHIGQKFSLRIEPLNYDHAYIYSEGKPVVDQGGNRVKAINKEMFHSALADHQEGEAIKLDQHEAIKKQQTQISAGRFAEYDLLANQAGVKDADMINPRLFGQKEMSDPIKIAASERLVNNPRYSIEELEPEPEKKKATISRFE